VVQPASVSERVDSDARNDRVRGLVKRRTSLIVVALAVAAASLLAVAPGAMAAKGIVDVFDGPSAAGFGNPNGVAVNDTSVVDPRDGYVYVVSENEHRVEVFNASYQFQFMFGGNVNATTPGNICPINPGDVCQAGNDALDGGGFLDGPQGIAIDQSDGSVYVMDEDNARVVKYDRNGSFLWTVGNTVNADGLPSPDVCLAGDTCKTGTNDVAEYGFTTNSVGHIGVDPNAPHDVFVADEDHNRVQVFESSGTFAYMFGRGVAGGAAAEICTAACANGTAGTAVGQFTTPIDVAVGDEGDVYVVDRASSGRVQRFDAPETSVLAPNVVVFAAAALSGAPTLGWIEVDNAAAGAADDVVYAEKPDAGGEWEVREIAAASGTVVDTHANGAGLSLTAAAATPGGGLAYDPDGDRILISQDNNPDDVFVLDDIAGPLVASLQPATSVTATAATLNATINPNGSRTRYRFEISSDGVTYTPVPVPDGNAGVGVGAVPVTASATGLSPNTLYRMRLVATRVDGQSFTSPEQTFATAAAPPEATTLGSADRTDTSVRLRGMVDPQGSATTYHFEYGLPGSFDHVIPVPDGQAGAGNSPLTFVEDVTGLLPQTEYRYRIVATNAAGTDIGDPVSFTTNATPVPTPPQGGRGFELVSPPDKVSGIGVGTWYSGPGAAAHAGVAAYEGERFASTGRFGAMLLDGSYAFADDWAFASRDSDEAGWVNHSPIAGVVGSGSNDKRMLFMRAASDDLTTVAWGSNAGLLRVFPEMASWTAAGRDFPFVGSWDGRWEPFVTDQAQYVGGPADAPETAVSGDGSAAIIFAPLRGLAGAGDPTHPSWPDLVGGRSVYIKDLPDGPSGSFAGAAIPDLVNVCTDEAGRTALPSVDGSGDMQSVACPAAVGASERLISDRGATLHGIGPTGRTVNSLANVVSHNGSRVFFMSPDPTASGVPDGASAFCSTAGSVCPPQLYVRQRNSDGTVVTRWISKAVAGLLGTQDATLTGAVRFEGATSDGDKVFFRTNSPLTTDDPNGGAVVPGGVKTGTVSNSSWDLYMYDLADGSDPTGAGGVLTRITRGPTGTADANGLQAVGGAFDMAQGLMRFASTDGSRIYFATAAPLPGVPLAGSGTSTEPGGTPTTGDAVNLYLYSDTGGSPSWRFVARLPSDTSGVAACASVGTNPSSPLVETSGSGGDISLSTNQSGSNCVRGTDDGEFVTFWTSGRLLAEDPDVSSADVYAYDAAADDLERITAPQGGAGGTYQCTTSGTPVPCHGDPGFDTGASTSFSRAARAMLGVATQPLTDGAHIAFFQSKSRLVPEDTDSAYDVYEWRDGELLLLTPGDNAALDGAFYKGNDHSGRNVYFATRDRLTWQDYDSVLDVYTARTGSTGIPQPSPPPVCATLGDACQGGGAAPTSPSVGSTGPSDDNASPGVRAVLSVAGPGRVARARAAASGVVRLRVRTNVPGTVRAVATARIRVKNGSKRVRVARGRSTLSAAGATGLRLRLDDRARSQLAAGRRVALTIRVTMPGARSRSIGVVLRRAGK
jgi:hypothetical protein